MEHRRVRAGDGGAPGDALLVELVELAGRLRSCLRPGDTVARLGGDEFAVLVEQHGEPAAQVPARLVDALSLPLQLGSTQVTVSVSVGLATTTALLDDGLDARELLRRADTAMYAAKGKGKATWVPYDPQRHKDEPSEVLLPR